MIIILGFAIAIIVVSIGLRVFPDITTFALFGSLGAFIVIGVVAGLGPEVIANGYVVLIILAGAALFSIFTFRRYRSASIRRWSHIHDDHKAFVIRQRRNEARYQRQTKRACPETYTPGKPSMRDRMVCPPEWGAEIDWTQKAMDGSKHGR